MRDRLHSNLGFYDSSFIKMHVHSIESLDDITKFSIETEATYFHEYIHFLQDITSTYGLMNISNIVDYIKHVNDVVLNDANPEFAVPFIPQNSVKMDVGSNWKLKSIYLGGGYGYSDVFNVSYLNTEPVSIQTINGYIQPQRLIIKFENPVGRAQQTSIGAFCVSECMAYLMEQQLYPNILPQVDKLPYESIKIVCDELHPGFSVDPLNLIALCDACLMMLSPGQFLFEIVTEMSRENYMPKTPDDIYNHIFSRVDFDYEGNTNIIQLFKHFSSLGMTQLCDYFTTNQFKDNISWVRDIIDNGLKLRLNNPSFMLDIVRGGRLINKKSFQNKYFEMIFNMLGTPLIVNDEDQMFFKAPINSNYNLRLKYLWIISQVYKIYRDGLVDGSFKCEMIDWCNKRAAKKNIPEYTTNDCRYPWVRSLEHQPNECAFSRLWYMWGLINKEPISEKS